MSGQPTPGPWRAHVNEPGGPHFDTDDVYAPSGKVARMTGDVAHSYHDARLIASAPELLAALERAYELCVPPCGCDGEPDALCTGCRCEAALKAARGER